MFRVTLVHLQGVALSQLQRPGLLEANPPVLHVGHRATLLNYSGIKLGRPARLPLRF